MCIRDRSSTGAGNYVAGETVTIHAGSRNNYSFDGWTINDRDVTLANANKADTTFTMPNHAVTVTASWTYTDSSHDDDDDEDGGEATLSEQNLYRRLSEYYDLLEDLDSQVRGCAQNFNGNYLEEDRTTRQNLADVAERTEDTIEQYYDIVENLDVPTSSKNCSSWKDIIALYDDLDHRIDAICDAWEISLKYAKPADHKNEIVAPLSRDNVAGTNDNKYRLDFEERYPGAKPVEVN